MQSGQCGPARWVAVALERDVLVISAHLPHRLLSPDLFHSVLEELYALFQEFPKHNIILGMDANTRMYGTTDYSAVGPAVLPAELTTLELDRAAQLHKLAADHRLVCTNTWMEDTNDLHTRRDWIDHSTWQIDFILASKELPIRIVGVDHHTHFATDHRPVFIEVARKEAKTKRNCRGETCIRGWMPAISWEAFDQEHRWDWNCWDTCMTAWSKAASVHRQKPENSRKDTELTRLSEELRRALPEVKKTLSNLIID